MFRDHGETEAHTSKGTSPIHGSLNSCLGFLAAFSLGNLHQNYIFFSADFLIFLPIHFPFFGKGGEEGKVEKVREKRKGGRKEENRDKEGRERKSEEKKEVKEEEIEGR